MQTQIIKKLINDLNNHLQKVNSFGYKVLVEDDIKIMLNWYRTVHQTNNIDFKIDQVQLFGSSLTLLYSYFIMGLTSEGDCIISLSNLTKNLKIAVNKLNRKLIHVCKHSENPNIYGYESTEDNFLVQIKNQIESNNCKLILISNPNLFSHENLPKNILTKLVNYCQQNKIMIIFNEIESDMYPILIQSSIILKSDNIITVRQLGSILNMPSMFKYMCVYSCKQLKQKCIKVSSKFIKLLPSELSLALIKTTMNEKALKFRLQILKDIKEKWNIIKQAMQYVYQVHNISNIPYGGRFWIWVNSKYLDKRIQKALIQDIGFQKIQEYNDIQNHYRLDLAVIDKYKLQKSMARLKKLLKVNPKL